MLGRCIAALSVMASASALGTLLPFSFSAEVRIRDGDTVRIGMVQSLFKDVPESKLASIMQPFAAIMRSQTGVNGELVPGGDASLLSRQIDDGRVHLAVLHGIEYGWARLKYPDIRPLVVAVNQHHHLRAHLVVNQKAFPKFENLQNKVLALPPKTRLHCLLFLERRCKDSKKPPTAFFAKITNPPNAAEALDDVVDGIVQATVVDTVALDWFKDQKPVRFSKLQVVETSEAFPSGVIVYRAGSIEDSLLEKFRVGMVNMNKSVMGRELLVLWHLSAFEAVPEDYEKTVSDIVKSYPSPATFSK